MRPATIAALACLLVASLGCGDRGEQPPARTHAFPTTGEEAPRSRNFDRRFGDLQIREGRILPQLSRADELDAAARRTLAEDSRRLVDDLQALHDEDWLTPAQRTRVATERQNLENMRAMYLAQ